MENKLNKKYEKYLNKCKKYLKKIKRILSHKRKYLYKEDQQVYNDFFVKEAEHYNSLLNDFKEKIKDDKFLIEIEQVKKIKIFQKIVKNNYKNIKRKVRDGKNYIREIKRENPILPELIGLFSALGNAHKTEDNTYIDDVFGLDDDEKQAIREDGYIPENFDFDNWDEDNYYYSEDDEK